MQIKSKIKKLSDGIGIGTLEMMMVYVPMKIQENHFNDKAIEYFSNGDVWNLIGAALVTGIFGFAAYKYTKQVYSSLSMDLRSIF